MIIFPPLRTKRVAVTLRELTLNESIAICRLPADRPEATATEFLRHAGAGAKVAGPGYVTNPRLWTVEERTRLVCHYLSQVAQDGADFPVGPDGKLSDYLRFDADMPATEVDLGVLAGKARVLRPLLGVHVEVLERICENRGDWLHAVIACQIDEAGATQPDYEGMTDVQLFEWCTGRLEWLRGLPESEYEEVYAAWTQGRGQIEHFFVLGVDDEGLVFWPQEMTEAGPKTPARFRALLCISEGTRNLFAKPDQPRR